MSEELRTSDQRCYHWVARVPESLDGRIPLQLVASPDLVYDEPCCDGCCDYYHCKVCGKKHDVDSKTGRSIHG